jgi:16S rRNA G527 N7-methylase RsmG
MIGGTCFTSCEESEQKHGYNELDPWLYIHKERTIDKGSGGGSPG